MTKKYIIKALPSGNFFPSVGGQKKAFLGLEVRRTVANKDQFGNYMIDFKDGEQEKYEKLMQKPKGYLSTSGRFWDDRTHEDWFGEPLEGFYYKHIINPDPKTGEDIGMVLETSDDTNADNIKNTLMVKMLRFAPGVEWDGEKKYGAMLTITSVEEAAARRTNIRKAKYQAGAILEDLSIADQRKYYSIIFNKDHKDATDTQVYDFLSDYIEQGEAKANTFVALTKDMSVDEKYKYTLLYNKNKISKDGNGYHFNGIPLGLDMDKVYKFLADPKNQATRFALDQVYETIKNG